MIPAANTEIGERRHGISPAAAAIVVVLIVSAAAVAIVEIQAQSSETSASVKSIVTTTGQSSSENNFIQAGGGQQVSEQISLVSYNYQSIQSGVVISVRNAGATTVTVSTVFLDGKALSPSTSGCGTGAEPISLGEGCSFTLVPPVEPAAGTTHTIKLITSTGGTFVMTVVAGSSG